MRRQPFEITTKPFLKLISLRNLGRFFVVGFFLFTSKISFASNVNVIFNPCPNGSVTFTDSSGSTTFFGNGISTYAQNDVVTIYAAPAVGYTFCGIDFSSNVSGTPGLTNPMAITVGNGSNSVTISFCGQGGTCISNQGCKVLLYYNPDVVGGGCDANGERAVTNVIPVLTAAGAQVTTIGVCSPAYDPSSDNWLLAGVPNYTQVWDMRFERLNLLACTGTSPSAPMNDDFNSNWQTTATAYLNAGGNLYLQGENDAFFSRNTNDINFLVAIGATTNTFDGCVWNTATSNGYDDFYGTPQSTSNGFAAAQIVGWAVGGIPMGILNGISYAHDSVSGNWADGRDRSIAAGWSGPSQMKNLSASSNGHLFMVWDTTMWESPYYTSYPAVTNAFFTEVYHWLGGIVCNTPTPTSTPTNTGIPTATNTPTSTPTNTATNTPTSTPTVTPTPTNTPTPTFTQTPTNTPTITDTPTPTYTYTPTITPTPPIRIWPNPFNPSYGTGHLTVNYVPAGTTLTLYTIAGETVIGPIDAVNNTITWTARNKNGWVCSTGVYFYVIKNGSTVLLTGKLLVVTGK